MWRDVGADSRDVRNTSWTTADAVPQICKQAVRLATFMPTRDVHALRRHRISFRNITEWQGQRDTNGVKETRKDAEFVYCKALYWQAKKDQSGDVHDGMNINRLEASHTVVAFIVRQRTALQRFCASHMSRFCASRLPRFCETRMPRFCESHISRFCASRMPRFCASHISRFCASHMSRFYPSHISRFYPSHMSRFCASRMPRFCASHVSRFCASRMPRFCASHMFRFYPSQKSRFYPSHKSRFCASHVSRFCASHVSRFCPSHVSRFCPSHMTLRTVHEMFLYECDAVGLTQYLLVLSTWMSD
jgi:hypothetical protein